MTTKVKDNYDFFKEIHTQRGSVCYNDIFRGMVKSQNMFTYYYQLSKHTNKKPKNKILYSEQFQKAYVSWCAEESAKMFVESLQKPFYEDTKHYFNENDIFQPLKPAIQWYKKGE